MADYRPAGAYQFSHRKPLPSTTQISPSSRDRIHPLTKIVPDVALPPSAPQQMTATTSSLARKTSYNSPSQPQYTNAMNLSRRTPSTSTTSTAGGPSRTLSSSSTAALSRTASTRSGASTTPSSYVALMRKQKATVWCDRSQHQDPRLLAQQKAAKARAVREVNGQNPQEGRTSTSGSMGSGSLGVRSKIRHHGIPKASSYSYANLVGGGVPMRLSANEVENDGLGRDDDSLRAAAAGHHARSGSGRSSMGSTNKYLGVNNNSNNQRQSTHRYSEGSTPTSGLEYSPNGDIPELEETPVPHNHHDSAKGDYFAPKQGNSSNNNEGNSDSSSEQEARFGHVGQLKAPPPRTTATTMRRVEEGKSAEELRRRGSVDERANTMGSLGGGRLFVANPDLSD